MTSEGLSEIELRASGPRVVLRGAPRPELSALPADYRVETADERIVAEAYAARETVDAEIIFLSHDSVPLEDAAGLGLPTQVIPEEWLLEPEPSDIERELGEVKRRMQALEGRVPDIFIEPVTRQDGIIKLVSPYFPALSDAFVATVMRKLRKKYPLATAPAEPTHLSRMVGNFAWAEENRWEKYAESHAQWLADVQFTLEDMARHFSEDPHAMKLPLLIENRGQAAAEHLIVRIEARGTFHLVDVDALETEEHPQWYFPRPPAPPRRTSNSDPSGLDYLHATALHSPDYMFPHLPTPVIARDRHALYWDYNDDRHANRVEGQCADFRHGLPPEEFVLSVERDAIGDEPIRGALSVLVSAGNLSEPKKATFPILIEAQPHDTEVLVRGLLKRELDVEV